MAYVRFPPLADIRCVSQCGHMKRVRRVLFLVLGSAIYWIAAAFIILILGSGLPGDCGTGRTPQDMHDCLQDVRLVVIAGVALAASLYGVALWRFARRS